MLKLPYKIPVLALVILIFPLVFCGLYGDEISRTRLRSAIPKAVTFLSHNQLNTGEFKTFCAEDESLGSGKSIAGSPLITAYVLNSLGFVKDTRVKGMVGKGLTFLLKQGESPGIWRFKAFIGDQPLDPDLDVISTISFILEQNDIPMQAVRKIILEHRDEEGLFYTWVRDSTRKNQVDCGVNANIMLCMGKDEVAQPVCDYLNLTIETSNEVKCSSRYHSELGFYYLVSRAYFNGVACLEESMNLVIRRVISHQEINGSFGNELFTGLAINTLLNCGYEEHLILDKAIRYLLGSQTEKGSWLTAPFFINPAPSVNGNYTYCGTEELTTAVCLEALARYSAMINGFEKLEDSGKE